MVTGIEQKVTIQEYYPHAEKEKAENVVAEKVDEGGNPIVVSKDFILNLLSLAIGKPFFLERNLGQKVDVKI